MQIPNSEQQQTANDARTPATEVGRAFRTSKNALFFGGVDTIIVIAGLISFPFDDLEIAPAKATNSPEQEVASAAQQRDIRAEDESRSQAETKPFLHLDE
ncbi:MAG: hypothetical protein VXZ82_16525 [Planctomycetota bacterium]|nr:hypothetical protein [Planctomycetota bacterium]